MNESDQKQEYPGGPTWADLEYDPHFQKREKFVALRSVGRWLRDNILASVLLIVLTVVLTFYITQWLERGQKTSPPQTSVPTVGT